MSDGKAGETVESAETRGFRQRISNVGSTYGILIFFIFLLVFFSGWLPDRFPTLTNLRNVLGDQAIPGMLALAAMLPLAAGEFDLTVGATLGFNSIMAAYLTMHGVSVAATFFLCLAIGLFVGTVNAFFVVRVGVNAFIATLGVGTVLSGMNLLVSGGRTLFEGIPATLKNLAIGSLGGLPLTVYYFLALILILWYVMDYTPYGRYLRATGSGREAARLTGVRTGSYLASAFILSGAIAGICGFLTTARIGSATASVGPEYLLPAYAAAFLGATTIQPGRFNTWGTVIGALTLAVGITGLQLAGAPFWVPNLFNGFALLIAVSAAVIVGRRSAD